MSRLSFKKNYLLKKLTTMKIGGPAKYFFIAKSEEDLIQVINRANKNKIKWYVIGEGSNLIPSDNGFNGLIIKNQIENFKKTGNKIYVGAGNNLFKFISKLNKFGLAGMEKMVGIPGTVGGAIYGSAGAYGQEIKDCLTKVRIFDASIKLSASGKNLKWLSKKQCRFGYRESIFKENKDWVILAAEFKFKNGNPKELSKISKGTIRLREQKYRPGLLCPGSFFKNIVIKDIEPVKSREKFLEKINKEKIIHGKVSSGYILELVGAKGVSCGNIKVAKHHGNLIYNSGEGKASEIEKLAKILKIKVKKRFGVELEEEIQYL